MVDHAAGFTPGQQHFEFFPQERWRLEVAAGIQIEAKRTVQCARDMTGHGIQGFHFSAKAWRCPGIDDGGAGCTQCRQNLAGLQGANQRGLLAKRLGRGRAQALVGTRFNSKPCGLPGLQTTVKHGNGLVSTPLEHPPQAPTVVGALAVIDHHLLSVRQSKLFQPGGKTPFGGQRVAPGARFKSFALVAQVAIQIGMHRSGDMRLRVLGCASVWVAEVKAAIQHERRLPAGQACLKILDGYENGVHARIVVCCCITPACGAYLSRRCTSMPITAQWRLPDFWRQCSSAGALGTARSRKMVAVMPLTMMRPMPAQPMSGNWSPKIVRL